MEFRSPAPDLRRQVFANLKNSTQGRTPKPHSAVETPVKKSNRNVANDAVTEQENSPSTINELPGSTHDIVKTMKQLIQSLQSPASTADTKELCHIVSEQKRVIHEYSIRTSGDLSDDIEPKCVLSALSSSTCTDIQASLMTMLLGIAQSAKGQEAIESLGGIEILHNFFGEAMQSHVDAQTTAADAVRVMHNIASRSVCARHNIRDLGVHIAVVSAMRKFSQFADFLAVCIRFIGLLAAEDFFEDARPCVQDDPAAVVASGMVIHGSDEQIQAVGCAALGNLVSADDETSDGRSEAEVDAVIAALTRFPASGRIAANACFAICSFSCNPILVEHMIQHHEIMAILAKVLKEHATKNHIVRDACRSVENILVCSSGSELSVSASFSSSLNNSCFDHSVAGSEDITSRCSELCINSGICSEVASALHKAVLEDQASVTQSACTALAQLSNFKALREAIVLCGGTDASMIALEKFKDVPRVVEDALCVIDNLGDAALMQLLNPQLARQQQQNRFLAGRSQPGESTHFHGETMSAAAGVRVFVKIMEDYQDHLNVQLQVSRCLRLVSFHDGLRKVIGKSCGVDGLLQTMVAFGDNAELQDIACTTLANLAHNNDNAHRIAVNDGVRTIVAAMRGHADNADIQQEACRALRVLAKISVNRQHIYREGGISAVLAATTRHVGTLSVVVQACRALLVLSSSTNMADALLSEGVPSVLQRLIMHVAEDGANDGEVGDANDCDTRLNEHRNKVLQELIKLQTALLFRLHREDDTEDEDEGEREQMEQTDHAGEEGSDTELQNLDPANNEGAEIVEDGAVPTSVRNHGPRCQKGEFDNNASGFDTFNAADAEACGNFVTIMSQAWSSTTLCITCVNGLSQLLPMIGSSFQGHPHVKMAVKSIVALVITAPDVLEVQEVCFRALNNICSSSITNSDTFVEEGGIDGLGLALSRHGTTSATLCKNCCRLLTRLGNGNSNSNILELAKKTGLTSSLSAILRQHGGTDFDVARLALSLLKSTVVDHQENLCLDYCAVFKAMAAHAGTVDIQNAALKVLNAAFCVNSAKAVSTVIKFGMGHIVTAIARHRRNGEVANGGLMYLCKIQDFNKPAESQLPPLVPEDQNLPNVPVPVEEVFAINGGLETVCQAMTIHVDSSNLQELALQIVLRACTKNAVNLRQCVHLNAIDLTLRALNGHKAVTQVQKAACAMLQLLASKPRFRTKLQHRQAVWVAVRALQDNVEDQDVQAAGLSFLRRMVDDRALVGAVLSKNMDGPNNDTGADSIASVAMRALELHKDDLVVQREATAILEVIARVKQSSFSKHVQKAVPLLLNALAALPHCAVQRSAMGTLKLVACSDAGRQTIVAAGGVQHVIKSMKTNQDCEKIQGYCTFVLAHVAHVAGKQDRQNASHEGAQNSPCTDIVRLGGVDELVGVLVRFPTKSKLCRLSCAALGALTQRNMGVIESVLACDGVRQIIEAMKFHSENTEIQKIACALLGNLVRGAGAREKLREMGGTEFVVGVMRKNIAHAGVQTVAISVLSALCKQNDGERRLLGVLGIIDVVLKAMRLHAADIELQRSSFHFLRSLSRVEENRRRVSDLAGTEYVIAAIHARMTEATTKKIIDQSLLSGKNIVAKIAAILGP